MSSFSEYLKSVGAGILTLVLFVGLGYFVYTSLFVTQAPSKTDDVVATHTMAPAQPAERVTVNQKKPS